MKKEEMKLFVWDFHGVLEKGNDFAVLEITNIALAKLGYLRRMTEAESGFLSGLRWHEYFAHLLPKASEQECQNLQSICFEISENQPEIVARNIKLNDHADHVLETIQKSGQTQILISNTLPRSLDMFVKIVNIEKYFPLSHRFGVDSHHQRLVTKKHCLEEFMRGNPKISKLIAIGDSPGDMALIDENEKIGATGYLYAHPEKVHRSAKCHYKINDLRLVLQELNDSK